MRYRPQRGLLSDAMKECVEVDGAEGLAAHIGAADTSTIVVKYMGHDPRIWGNTWIVTVDGKVAGWTDAPV